MGGTPPTPPAGRFALHPAFGLIKLERHWLAAAGPRGRGMIEATRGVAAAA